MGLPVREHGQRVQEKTEKDLEKSGMIGVIFVKKPGRTWQGCYAYVRHPMYTALWLWALGNALLWHGAALWIQAFFW